MRACAPAIRFCLVALAAWPAWGVESPIPAARQAVAQVTPPLPASVELAMREGKFVEAAEALDRPTREATDASTRAYFGLIRGIAFRLSNKLDAARSTIAAALQADPDGPWATKLRAELAGIHLAQGRPAEAEALARSEVLALLSEGRKDRLAEVYRAFALKLLASGDPLARPDPAAARDLLIQGRFLARGEPLRARMLFETAAASLQGNHPADAVLELQSYLADYPKGSDRDLVRLRLGDAQVNSGDRPEARRTWTDLARSAAPGLRAMASYRVARSFGVDQTPMLGGGFQSIGTADPFPLADDATISPPANDADLGLQVAALRRLIASDPADPLAVRAASEIGDLDRARGKTEEALKAYRSFLAGEGFRVESDESRRIQTERTMATMYAVGEVLNAQGKPIEAIAAWEAYLGRFPNSGSSSQAQKAILTARFAVATELLDRKDFNAARVAYRDFIARNPIDDRVPEALFQVAESHRLQARADEAVAAYEALIARYPTTEPASHARYRLGVLFEEEKGELDRAIEEYRKVPPGPWQGRATQRVAVMEAASMQVVTPRTFRSGEVGHLAIATRNLETLSFAAYRLDPEAYFRKKQTLSGVEALDVGLVAPDAEWTEPVPGQARYKPVEASYPLKALEGPGFWAVKVTDGSRLQATTMVLRSDIDAVVKASSDQVLIFVQDRKTGRGRADARVLISDGAETILEARTGGDGVVIQDGPTTRNPSSKLAYLVLDGAEAAGSGLSLPDTVTQGLSPRNYVYTDRPAYRPGQAVGIRGVVRAVIDGSYAVPAGDSYDLVVADVRGRRILVEPIKLSEFGTFHASVSLAEAAVVGLYTISLTRPNSSEIVGKFEVEAYELQKADLRIDLPRAVVYRGEMVKLEIVARYQYGSPIAGRGVVATLPDGRIVRGTTDGSGKFPIEFSTDDFGNEATLTIKAQLPEDNVTATATIRLALRGFRIELETDRSVYLSGEPFRLRVRTLDPLGEPVGQSLTLSVLKRVERPGSRLVEAEVSTGSVMTDSKTGRGETGVTIGDADGGPFLLRVSGLDRFGNAIFEDRPILVSGKADATRLRILADRQEFKVGESARVNLHNRGGAGLALVAWEADRLLGYKLVDLAVGDNPLIWDVVGRQFPNFTLSASRIEDTRLDQARLDLKVTRDLRVVLKPVKPTVMPGEEVEVEVTTVDQLDRPVAAELSLALVDKALLRLHADAVPPIGPFFHDRKRTGAFATASTNGFRYAPVSRAVEGANPTPNSSVAVFGAMGLPGASPGIVAPRRSGHPKVVKADDMRGDADDPKSRAVLLALAEPVTMHFPEATPLGDVLRYIRQATASAEFPSGLPIYVDPTALQDVDTTLTSATVTIDLEGIPLRTSLRLILSQVQLTYVVGDGLLSIVTAQSLEPEVEMGGIETRGMGGMGGGMGGMGGGGGGFQGGSGRVPAKLAPAGVDKEAEPPMQKERAAMAPAPLAELARAPEPARQQFVETAFWNPSVVTGPDGKARVKFPAPSALSEYVFMARGVTGSETLTGQATAELAVRKDLFLDFRQPIVLIQGDRPRFSARVHHSGVRGKLDVKLSLYAGGRTQVDPRSITVTADGVDEFRFDPFDIPDGDVVRLVLTTRGGDLTDEVVAEIPIRPWGVREVATASGRSSNETVASVSLPPGRTYDGVDMAIVIAPTTERLIVDLAMGREAARFAPSEPVDTNLDRASELLSAASALGYLKAIGSGDAPDAGPLADRVRGLVSSLMASQNPDHGWPWVSGTSTLSPVNDRAGNPTTRSDRSVTARVVWALSTAEAVGLLEDREGVDRASGYLTAELARSDASDLDARSAILHALSLRGKAGFEAVNALNRVRDDLSDPALASLALTLVALDRQAMAGEVLDALARRARVEEVGAGQKPRRFWSGGRFGEVEATSLATLAMAKGRPSSQELPGAVDWLLTHRSGMGWRPHKATGLAVAALSAYESKGKVAVERYRLVIAVNGREVSRTEVAGRGEPITIAVPRAAIKADGKNQVTFAIEGRGTFGYVATMTGFARDFGPPLPGFRRLYRASAPELMGRTLPTGYSSTKAATVVENLATMVPLGSRVKVLVDAPSLVPDRVPTRSGYQILEEPLPAGTSLVEGSVKTQAKHFTLADGVLTFYFGPGEAPFDVEYELYGLLPGRYRVLPSRLRDADDPGRSSSGPLGTMTVLAPGEPVTDPYKPTPDELLARGKALFDAGLLAESAEPLEALMAYELNESTFKDVARMLLYAHLATYQPRKIVEDFERIREKSPELVVPFDKLLTIGRAYADIGEHERAYLGWRALAEASYLEDARVAQMLRQRNQPLEAAAFLVDLWRAYPDEASIESDFFDLSRLFASLAARPPAELAKSGVTRAELLTQASRLVRSFLARSPTNPLVNEASLALIGDELDRKDDAEAVGLAERFASIDPTGPFFARFRYAEALGRFHLGQYDRSAALARELASNVKGDEATSNRWQAVYLLGQVEEARGKPAEALAHYRRVADRFTDAGEAVQALTLRSLKLPDVSVIRPGGLPVEKKSDVSLAFRNVAEVEVKVYPIDLMRFTRARKGLDAVASIDLAGVRPLAQQTVKLGDGLDFEDKLKVLDLPIKDEGAFLVMARGGNLFASGIVLVSSLDLDVTEQATGGFLRVTARDATTGARVPDVQISVVGSSNEAVFEGQTDLRGVFLAQGLRGQAAVVARQANRYALYRGATSLGTIAGEANRRGLGLSLEDNLRDQNQLDRDRQLDRFEKRLKGSQGGMGGMSGGGFR